MKVCFAKRENNAGENVTGQAKITAGMAGNGSGKSNFSSKHDDINLTKEETEFLEAQFLKYLSREMEKDPSNWGQFYDILKEETSQANGSTTSQGNSATTSNCNFESRYQDEAKSNGQRPNSSSNGFKVNTEKTKQQYRSSHNEKQSWNRSQESAPPKSDNNFSQNTKYRPDEKPSTFNREQNDRKNNCTKSKSGRAQKKKEDSEKPRGKRKSVPKQTKQQKQQTEESYDSASTSSETCEEYSAGRKVLRIIKDVCIIFACFIIMIIFFVLKFCWNVGKKLLGYSILLVLFIVSRLLGLFLQLNNKYQILSRVVTHSNNLLELLHLVLGINIKGWFQRWRNKNRKPTQGVADNRPPPELPTTSEDAIKFLLSESSDNPFRILCASYKDDSEKLRSHYRKLVRLVHPDKCNLPNAEDAFKVLDTAFKKLTDPEKREELNTEMERQKAWDEFNQQMGEDWKKMYDDLLTTIQCSVCQQRHKKNLIKDRTCFSARYCAECNTKHPAQDGDVWTEVGMLGVNWTCYACFDGEVFELTQWGKCQNLNTALPANSHRVFCQLGTRSSEKTQKSNSHTNHHQNKEENNNTGRSRGGTSGGRNKKGKKKR